MTRQFFVIAALFWAATTLAADKDVRSFMFIGELPDDNEVIQAVYVMRLPSGMLNSSSRSKSR